MEQRFVFLLGGACVASGIAIAGASDAFGLKNTQTGERIEDKTGETTEALGASEAYDQLGYNGIDNLHWDGLAFLALVLFFGGVGILANANRHIWKQTGGY